ncbi:hypothetical protein MTR_1g051605 [Medicago truncatula]|uniref:Uncharacterized protein n=1 Tax=Medicago truncatula TaxID=3880 RepID=A0A072VI70_MEDTR|nr:hypothetical protein MTR_1g051605 [Medicago truncatula]
MAKVRELAQSQSVGMTCACGGTTVLRGVRGAVWFGFKHNNHPNRERKKHAVWFGSVDF